MKKGKKILKVLIIIFLPFLLSACLIATPRIYFLLNNNPNTPSAYENPKTFLDFGVELPLESESIFHCSKAVSFNEVQGVAEFKINSNCDLSCFENYELTNKYNQDIERFFDELFTYYKDMEKRSKFREYLQYYRTHEAYVLKGYVHTYSLYYPEDNKVIILFCQ